MLFLETPKPLVSKGFGRFCGFAGGTVKAINATTVEVTFADEVADVKALDFAIKGLDVSNAVVKQTDKKTVVLTTSAQTAGVEYTVTVNEKEVGKFTGLSAVVPTKVELVSSSVQGKLGQQVTVQAKVTVAEGASKAGIPVTFSIPGNNNDAVYPTVTGEAHTDANGVATYTYTRYGAGKDSVTAYATGDRSKFATGYVFWGVDTIVSIEEVTTGAVINNGANKTYKVTYKHPTTGKPVANQKLNVSVLENINVTADKLQNVKVNGIDVKQLSNNTVVEAAQITTDSKGEATFTLSGTNAEATPVVFEAHSTNESNKFTKNYAPSDLQATAAKVKFSAVQAEYNIELTRDGGEVAATGQANGREYNVVVKDKNGNVAKNETVNIAFNEDLDRVISTNTKAGFVDPDTDKFYPTSGNGDTKSQISVKTNDKGEASFIIASEIENDYATPIAWIDINSSNAKRGALDEGEPTKVASISHFQAPYLDGAEIKSYKAGKKDTKFVDNEKAEFKAELVNQSGKVFTGGYTMGKVTYTVFNTGAEDIEVGDVVISPNRSETFTKEDGASLFVNSKDGKSTSVRVIATGIAYKGTQDYSFSAKEATATFTNSATIGAAYSGYLASYNTDNKSISFVGKNAVKYAGVSGKTYEYYGVNGAPLVGADAFILALETATGTTNAVYATYKVDGDVVKFYLERTTAASASTGPVVKKENVTPAPGVNGTISFTQGTSVNYTQDLTVNVTDADLNVTSGPSNDNVQITYTLTGGANAGTYTITLAETATAGTFTADIPSAIYQGATSITAKYVDAKTSTSKVEDRTVTATIVNVLGVVNSSADPIVAYNDGVSPATLTITPTGTNTARSIDITIGGVKKSVVIPENATLAQVVAAVNAQFSGVAAVVGTDVVLTATNKTDSIVTGITADANVGFAEAGSTTNPTPGTATEAVWAFDVTTSLAVGEKLKVTLGSTTKTVTIAGAGDAAEIVSLLNASPAFSADYTVAASGSRVTITQNTAAPTTGTSLSVSISK